jgi:hypothetical protein
MKIIADTKVDTKCNEFDAFSCIPCSRKPLKTKDVGVKLEVFHGGNGGSTPPGDAIHNKGFSD